VFLAYGPEQEIEKKAVFLVAVVAEKGVAYVPVGSM
jgi:hypothetical protein